LTAEVITVSGSEVRYCEAISLRKQEAAADDDFTLSRAALRKLVDV
jgi:hypothetical protein